jgi:hypothetical protein
MVSKNMELQWIRSFLLGGLMNDVVMMLLPAASKERAKTLEKKGC